MGQYEEIRDRVNSLIPDNLKAGNLVEEKFYKRTFWNAELNFNPYKNNGKILPEEYKYFNKREGYYAGISKGHWWLPQYIFAMEKYKELNFLPVAFILLFFREYKKLLSRSCFECDDIISAAAKELRDNRYGVPDHKYKNFILNHSECNADLCAQLYETGENLTLKQLSKFIVESICSIVDLYKLEYWRFSDKELKRAYSVGRQAQETFWKTIKNDPLF